MYLKRLIKIVIITLLVAYTTGSWFDDIYKKRWSTLFFEKLDELIKGHNNYDMIFLGNSRVHFGINPYYIDSVTKYNSYNFGTGAADALDIGLTTNVYLQQHKAPKLAIISLDMGTLVKKQHMQTRFHYLFYLGNDTIRKYMKQAGFLTGMMYIFPFTKYSFLDEYNRTSIFVKGKQYPLFDHNLYKGFLNTHQHINSKNDGIFNTKIVSVKVWDTAIISLRNTVLALQQKGCKVIFVSPPEKSSYSSKEKSFRKITDSIFTAIANDYHLKFLHFDKMKLYTDDYFVDEVHLNEPGTRIYSIQLADSIKSLYPYSK